MPENDSDEQSQLSYYENNCPIHNSSRVSFSMSQKFKIENPRNLSDVFMCYEKLIKYISEDYEQFLCTRTRRATIIVGSLTPL